MSKHDTPARHQWYEGHPCVLPPARTDGGTQIVPDDFFANTQIDLRERSRLPASRLAIDRHPEDAHRTGFVAGIRAAKDIVKQLRQQEGYDAGNATLPGRLDLAIRDVEDNADAHHCTGAGTEIPEPPLPDDVATPSLDVRARNAALDAATYAEAWIATLGEVADDKRRHRAMRQAGNAASYARLAAKAMDKAMAEASAE